jgi:hypothetical protein
MPCSSTEERLQALFGPDSKYRGHCANGIDEAGAEQIDSLLAAHHHAVEGERVLRVDRARLADSWEAWVHVVGAHPERPPRLPLASGRPAPLGSAENARFWPFFVLPSDRAVLTWANGD